MKKTKKVISIILLMTMLIGLFPVQVLQQSYAEPVGTMSEDITITLDFNGGLYYGVFSTFPFKWKKAENFILPNDKFAEPPEGKVFKAWLVGSEEKNIGEEITLTEDTTIKAIWKDSGTQQGFQEYDLTFDVDFISGDIDTRETKIYKYTLFKVDALVFSEIIPPFKANELVALEINGVRKELGFGFVITEDTTIKAIYNPIGERVNVTFKMNDLSNAELEMDVKKGTDIFDEIFFRMLRMEYQGTQSLKEIKVNGVPKNFFELTELIITEDTTIEFIWETTTVSFDANGGTGTMENASARKYSSYILPDNEFTPPPGKEFKAWQKGSSEYAPGETIYVGDDDITLKAIWKDEETTPSTKYTITYFSAGNGIITGKKVGKEGERVQIFWISDYQYDNGDLVVLDSDNNLISISADGFEMPASNVRVYATFKLRTPDDRVTVIYDANNGTSQTETYEYDKNAKIFLDLINPYIENGLFTEPAGKEFKAWLVNGEEKNPFDIITVTEDITIKAIWKDIIEKVKITFNADGGSGTMPEQEVNKNTNYTLPANGFTAPTGKEFKAWLVGTEEKAVGDEITVTANTEIKAVWKDKVVAPSSGGGGSYSPTRPDTDKSPSTNTQPTMGDKKLPVELRMKVGSKVLNKDVGGTKAQVNMDIAPFIRNGRVMVPMRFIGEALDYEVKWDALTKTVILIDSTTKIEIPTNTTNIVVNGIVFTSDIKPISVNGRVMLSIGNIVKALGQKNKTNVTWEQGTQEIVINR